MFAESMPKRFAAGVTTAVDPAHATFCGGAEAYVESKAVAAIRSGSRRQ